MQPSKVLPVIPLRNAVLFPGVSFPIAAGRPGTLHAIETAMKSPDQLVFAVTQRQDLEAVTPELLHTVGTIASIGPIQRGVGGARLLLQGKARGIAMRIEEKEGRLEAVVVEAEEMAPLDSNDAAFVALLLFACFLFGLAFSCNLTSQDWIDLVHTLPLLELVDHCPKVHFYRVCHYSQPPTV